MAREPNAKNAEDLNKVALSYQLQSKWEVSELTYKMAMAIDPKNFRVIANYASLLIDIGRFPEAEQVLSIAIQIEPKYSYSYTTLGALYIKLSKWVDAQIAYDAAVWADLTDARAQGMNIHCRMKLCDWTTLDEKVAVLVATNRHATYCAPPFVTLALTQISAVQQREMAERFGQCFKIDQLAKAVIPTYSKVRDTRLRVGFISSDFHDHPTMYLLAGVLRQLDPLKISTHIYSYGPNVHSELRRRLISDCDKFIDISIMDDVASSETITSDGIDILVDLKGYTNNCRLGISALRPAPVIVSWLGYPGTLGVTALADYIIGDEIVTPEQNSYQFSERIANMPHCYQPNDCIRPLPTTIRSIYGLPDNAFVFCNFNRTFKLTPQIFSLWCNLLKELPETVLWMRRPDEDTATSRLKVIADAQGIGENRLIFATHCPLEEHMSRLQLADLALDTYPCNSHTTASDALRAGVPIVTMRGETFASRVAGSLLTTIGIPELIATDEKQYKALATRMVLDDHYRSGILARLKDGLLKSPLFDPRRFARDLEELLAAIWSDAQSVELPRPSCVRAQEKLQISYTQFR